MLCYVMLCYVMLYVMYVMLLIDAKRLFQEIKSVSFFHISAVLVRTGVCAYIDGTLLLILFKRYEVSTVEIHLDSADNISAKKNGSKASFKND